MDLHVYISQIETRLFLALSGLVGAFFLDVVNGTLFRHHADPRPMLERVTDTLFYPLAARMNRAGRADTTLLMRGIVVLAVACAVSFGVIGFAYHFAKDTGYGGTYLTVLVALSTGTIGWFAPLKALAVAIGNPKAPRPYLALARATYSNLVTLDEHGLIRVAATAAIRSLAVRTVAPVLLYVLFGWQALAIYWPIMVLALSTGQDGTSSAFAVVANGLATVLLLLPMLLLCPVLLVALFFSAGASFFRALPAMFKVIKWPSILQGGAPLLLVAYAMKLMLGGPRQDRTGVAVGSQWVGPEGGTAKLAPRDIGRILYLQGVTLLIFVSLVYCASVLL
ncbi:MAG: hypothetical protein KGQ41_05850 [Alphaproteobacteria bacterium]|nr:hypothetical protein [Alphaproteobacteria bacterium]